MADRNPRNVTFKRKGNNLVVTMDLSVEGSDSSTGETFAIEALARRHDRSRFDCGSEHLDRYIRRQASQDARRRVARVFAVVPEGSSEVAGFYTLSAASIERIALPTEMARRLPRYPVPVALIGRLAVDRRWRGKGLGSALLADAFRRVIHAGEALAVYAVIVDAKDAQAQTFYERFGFTRLPDTGRRLFYPMTAAERLVGD